MASDRAGDTAQRHDASGKYKFRRAIRRALLSGSVMALALSPQLAHASAYDITFSGTGITGNATVLANGNTASFITGTVTDANTDNTAHAITGLSNYRIPDQFISAASPYVDSNGLAFADTAASDNNYILAFLSNQWVIGHSVGGTDEAFFGASMTSVVHPAIDNSQSFFDQNSTPLAQSTVVFDGGVFKPTGAYTLSAPVLINTTGGTVDGTNGNVTLSGGIAGPGGLTISAGTVIITGVNTYSGTTTINSGATLQLGNGSGFGLLAGAITDNGVVVFDGGNGSLASYVTGITGSGGLTFSSGTLTLSGNNTYSGTTTISSGATAGLTGTGSIASSSGVSDSGTFDISGTTSGASITTLSGSGTVALGGQTLTLTAAAGTFSGALTDGGLSGGTGGGPTIAGGTEILTGVNTFSGTTTINSGATLQLGNGSGFGLLAGAITDNGVVVFDGGNGSLASYVTGITGSGGLTFSSGTLTLSGNNTYSGTTTISSGATAGLTGTGSIASSSGVSDSGTFDISGTTSGASITTLSGSGTVALGGQTLTLTAAAGTFSGALTDGGLSGGTGGNLTIAGGTEILTGVNTFSGTTTINSGATLQIGNAGTVGTPGTGGITDKGTLAYDRTNSLTITDAITGVGGLNVLAGTLTLNAGGNADTYSGATVISAGATLKGGAASVWSANSDVTVNSGGFLDLTGQNQQIAGLNGAGTVTSSSAGSVTFQIGANGDSGAFTGVIQNGSGTVGVQKLGAGIQTLGGANTFSGPVTVTQGTLKLGSAGALGSNSGVTIASAGTLDVNGFSTTVALSSDQGTITNNGTAATLTLSGSPSISGVIQNGTGVLSLAITGAGTVTLTGANTYSGTTTIAAGTSLSVSSGGTSGTLGTGPVTDNGALSLNRSDSITVADVISGSGNVTKLAAGTAILTGANTYSGVTTITAGILQIGNGGATGALGSGAVTDNATLTFNRSAVLSVANTISGTGNVTVSGTGAITFTAADNYSGGTTINNGATLILATGGSVTGVATVNSGGTLVVASGGSFGGSVTDNGVLAFNQSGTVTVPANISGSGSLTQAGSGTLLVNSALALTGTVNVNSGILEVGDAAHPAASLAGGVNVASGATLEGHGTVGGAVTLANGGTLRPGGSIGTLTVSGPVSIPSGTTFTEEFSSTTASKLAATGAVTLGGNLALVPDGAGFTNLADYQIVTGSSVTGTFASVTGAPAGFSAALVYSPSAVDLVLNSTAIFPFASFAKTSNQGTVAAAVAAGSTSAPLSYALGGVVTANSGGAAAALDSLSGEIHASLRTALAEDGRIIRTATRDHLADATSEQAITLWAAPFLTYDDLNTDGNTGELHHTNAGVIAGGDVRVFPGLRLGVEGAFVSERLSIPTRASLAHGQTGHAGVYAGYADDNWDFKFGADYGWGNDRISRTVSFLAETDTSKQSHQVGQVFGDAGYKFQLDAFQVEPYLDIAHLNDHTGGFTEAGGAMSDLTGGAATTSATWSVLGLRVVPGSFDLGGGMKLSPKLDFGWQHGFDAFRPVQSVTFVSTGTNFLVSGTPLDRDALASSAGLELGLAGGGILSVSYDGLLSDREASNTVKLQLDLPF